MRFSVAVTRVGDRVVARCIDIDRVAEAATRDEAIEALRAALVRDFKRPLAVDAPAASEVEVELIVIDDETT